MLEHKVDTQLMLNKLENKIKRSNQPVYDCVKLSDDEGKHTGRAMEVNSCLAELGL